MTKEFAPNPQKKHDFFFKLGLELRRTMYPFFKEAGANQREWKNVRQHTLVVVARVNELAEALGLPKEITTDLKAAASLHDFDKPAEVRQVKSSGARRETFQELARQQEEKITGKIHPKIQFIMDGAGVLSFEKINALLQKDFKQWTAEELAQAILHYVDDYTIENDWIQGVSQEGGLNQLDRRSLRQAEKPHLKPLDEDFQKQNLFNGETLHQAQRRIGHALEKIFVQLIKERSGDQIDPLDLPEFIDDQIVKRIEDSSTIVS